MKAFRLQKTKEQAKTFRAIVLFSGTSFSYSSSEILFSQVLVSGLVGKERHWNISNLLKITMQD